MRKEGSYYTQVTIIGGGISGTALLFMLSRYTDIGSVTLFEKYDRPATLNSSAKANSQEMDKEEEYLEMAHRIISKIPTIAAFAYRHSLGIPFVQPDIDLGFTKNFLTMMRAYPGGKMHLGTNGHDHVKDVGVRALDTIFTLHADHEQNASTTVVRGVASTGAHPYVAIASGISALWGRAHG